MDPGEGSERRAERRTERRRQIISDTLDALLLVKSSWNTVLLVQALDGSATPTAMIATGAALGLAEVVLRACKLRRH